MESQQANCWSFKKQLTTHSLNNAARSIGAKDKKIPLITLSPTGFGCVTVSPNRSSPVVIVTGPGALDRTVLKRFS